MIYFILYMTFVWATSVGGQQKVSAFVEADGMVVVEAEHYASQELTETRKWYRVDEDYLNNVQPDDEPHYHTASGAAYLEILPDTRVVHEDELLHGENFSNEPGKLGVLHYYVKFKNPGKYFVWVRAYSSGAEDNSIHVGLNDQWVESGQRMQWCEGKNQWTWASKQRTLDEHCGVEQLIFLDIPSSGVHKISFSMREDGFEFDKWVLSRQYVAPRDMGPAESSTKKVKPQ